MTLPVRVVLVPDQPTALVVHVDAGAVVDLGADGTTAPLHAPFDLEAVAVALAGVARVSASCASGPVARALAEVHAGQRRARRQQTEEQAALRATVMRGASSADVRTHAEAMTRKLAVDAELRTLRDKLGAAKALAYRAGVYMPRDEYQALSRQAEALAQESQALQVRMGELRRARKRSPDAFREAARRVLAPEVYDRIVAAIVDAEDDGTEDGAG